ncbi:MAG: hypothetical protein ACTSVG_09175, partial [Alphaproteobacteria bacterium]
KEIAAFIHAEFGAENPDRPLIMYDAAHVLGLLGPDFQDGPRRAEWWSARANCGGEGAGSDSMPHACRSHLRGLAVLSDLTIAQKSEEAGLDTCQSYGAAKSYSDQI